MIPKINTRQANTLSFKRIMLAWKNCKNMKEVPFGYRHNQ
jgi:hypothetical protein